MLWTVKAKPKSLGASLGLALNLGMSVMSIRSSIVVCLQTTKRPTCAQPNGVGGLNLNHSYALALSRLL
jgi:hypothetical protein